MKSPVPGLNAEQQAIYHSLARPNQELYRSNLKAGLNGMSVEAKDLREKSREAAMMLATMGAIAAPMAMAALSLNYTNAFEHLPMVVPALTAGVALVSVGATAGAILAKATEQASDVLVQLKHNTRAALSALRRDASVSLDGPAL